MHHPSEQNIKVSADVAVFAIKDGALCVLLIQMKKKPYEAQWAMPGGLIGDAETAADAAARILKDQTGLDGIYLEQLQTFDAPERDALGRVVSVAYMALLPRAAEDLRTTDKYADVRWWPVAKLPALAYDHAHMAATALARLRAKLGYTNIIANLLPASFTLGQLQDAYERVLGQELDKRNFRKKILALGLIEETGRTTAGAAHRPAALYRFRKRGLTYIEIL